MNNKTDRYFRDRLGGFENSPSDSTWDQIVQKMESRKKKKAAMIFFRIAAGMAILLSTGIGYYLLNRNEGNVTTSLSPAHNERNIASNKELSGSESSNPINKELNAQISANEKGEINQLQSNDSATPYSDVENNIEQQEQAFQEVIPEVTAKDETYDDLARVDQILPNVALPDSLFRVLNIPDQLADTGMTPAEAAALLLAQNDVEAETEKSRSRSWSLGSEIAPLYAHRNISSENGQSAEIATINNSESGVLAYAGGLSIALNTGKRLSVQTGIYYSRYGQEINQVEPIRTASDYPEKNNFIAVSNSTGTIPGTVSIHSVSSYRTLSDGTVYNQNDYQNGIVNSNVDPLVPDNAEDVVLRQYFNYFELPIILKYKVIDRKIDFSFSGGVITNFLVGNAINMISDGQTSRIDETTDINKINYQGSVGMGFEYPVADNFSFTLEPRFRYYINSINRSSDLSVHPFSLGFFAGINYRF